MEPTTREELPRCSEPIGDADGPRLKSYLKFIIAILIVPPFTGLTYLLGIDQINYGFIFILYWASIKGARLEELGPAVVGSIAGVGLAWLAHALPLAIGIAGYAVAGSLTLVTVYLTLAEKVAWVCNPATMLFLTIATIPEIVKANRFGGMMLSVVIAALFFGGLIIISTVYTARVRTWKARGEMP